MACQVAAPLRVVRAGTWRPPLVYCASDHLPVIAELAPVPPARAA